MFAEVHRRRWCRSAVPPLVRSTTIGKPSVSNTLPSTATPTLPQTSLPKKSTFGLFRFPYCGLNFERAPRRPAADDVDDAAHGVVAVQARARAVDDLDALGALQRHARPVDPAAERIVERHAVDEHERAADAARPDAAQRDALRGRMRRQAARAPEQAERRNLPEHVVGDDGRRLPGSARRSMTLTLAGTSPSALLGPRRRDGDRLEQRRRRQHDVAAAAAGRSAASSRRTRRRGRSGCPLRRVLEGEPPVRAGHRPLLGAGVVPHHDLAPTTAPPVESLTMPVTAALASTSERRNPANILKLRS